MKEIYKDLGKKTSCHDCSVKPGSMHKLGCDVERCYLCGGQLISCDCFDNDSEIRHDERMPWTGIWPGVLECVEYGLWAKRNPNGPGWIACDAEDPEAGPDLNSLCLCEWDRAQKKRLPPKNAKKLQRRVHGQ